MTELALSSFRQPSDTLSSRGQSKCVEIRQHEGGCRHLVKIYNDETLAHMRPDVLRKVIEWRHTMSRGDRMELDRIAAIPRHPVLDAGRLVGVAIPVAPQRFWFRSKSGNNQPRDASRLCVKPGRMVEHFSLPFRYAFLGHFLNALLWLHDHGAALGDVSLQNVLVGDDASCYLLDLDSAWLGRDSAFGAIENGRFTVTFDHAGFSSRTDLGKFAIVAVKVLGQDSALKKPASVKSVMAVQHYGILSRMWEGLEVDPLVVKKMADDWIKCSARDFGLAFRSTSVIRVEYSGDASVFSRAGAVTEDCCRPQAIAPPRKSDYLWGDATVVSQPRLATSDSRTPQPIRAPYKSDYSWVWWLVVLAIFAAAVWWFFLR